MLLDVAKQHSLQVALLLGTASDLHVLTPDELNTWLVSALPTFGSHSAFLRVQGKPLVFIWAPGARPDAVWRQQILPQVRLTDDLVLVGMGYSPGNLELFDGYFDYAVFGYPGLQERSQM